MKNVSVLATVLVLGVSFSFPSFADGKKGDETPYVNNMTAGCAKKGAPVKFDMNWGKETKFEGNGPTFSKLETDFINSCQSFHGLLVAKKIAKIHLVHDASKTEEGAYEMSVKGSDMTFKANLTKFRNSSATPRIADKIEELLK